MRWVKANIAAFGGDGDNIMIFGQSAGGNSVINHLAQPGQEKTNLLRCQFIL
jgi:para-nitrobenzyl esterase